MTATTRPVRLLGKYWFTLPNGEGGVALFVFPTFRAAWARACLHADAAISFTDRDNTDHPCAELPGQAGYTEHPSRKS